MNKITKTKEFERMVKEGNRYPFLSTWGLLFRFLIKICLLLDRQTKQKREKSVRKVNEWSMFLGRYLKKGKTIQEAARDWKKKNN